MGKSKGVHLLSGLVEKRADIASQHKAAIERVDQIKAVLETIDRALHLCGYVDDPASIPTRSKYRQFFGRGELKRIILQTLKEGPADDETIVDRIIEQKGWEADTELRTDILKRTRDAYRGPETQGSYSRISGLMGVCGGGQLNYCLKSLNISSI